MIRLRNAEKTRKLNLRIPIFARVKLFIKRHFYAALLLTHQKTRIYNFARSTDLTE